MTTWRARWLWRTALARILAASGSASDGESLGREAVALVEQTDDVNMMPTRS